jgi:hypothetical protein
MKEGPSGPSFFCLFSVPKENPSLPYRFLRSWTSFKIDSIHS